MLIFIFVTLVAAIVARCGDAGRAPPSFVADERSVYEDKVCMILNAIVKLPVSSRQGSS